MATTSNAKKIYYVVENSRYRRTWSRLPHEFASYDDAVKSDLVRTTESVGKQWRIIKVTEEIVTK